ncbi:DUF1963 domain-containing protein [Mycobacteroides sp. LB1]|uniref:YwqG family protein n=1 Tax=Mycobacteroides sp. LB1 TaxID=2750814 RepID=UPI0015DF9A2E|nr:DUF1963 domain-containing protein [Mycobacteroides sp. LB1]
MGILAGFDELLSELGADAVSLRPESGDPDIRSSYLGGHPYWPEGSQWPNYRGEPMSFVCQINFAEVPQLPGFPGEGLLQWFVGSDDVAGMTFDDTQGTRGFEVRWITDLSAPSTRYVSYPTPSYGDCGQTLFGVVGRCPGYDAPYSFQELNPLPYRIVFELVKTLPDSALHFTDAQRETFRTALKNAGVAVKDDPPAILRAHFDDLSYVWREKVFYKLSDTGSIWWGAHIGGHPKFIQDDVRGLHNYAPAGSPASTVLLSIGCSDLCDWWSGGTASLFGDPRALAAGDLSSIRYHTDR